MCSIFPEKCSVFPFLGGTSCRCHFLFLIFALSSSRRLGEGSPTEDVGDPREWGGGQAGFAN